MYGDEDTILEPRQAVVLLGLSIFIGTLISLCLIQRLGRRTLFLMGNLMNSVFLLMTGLLFGLGFPNAATLTLVLFIFWFSATMNVTYVAYLAEVSTDVSLGVSEAVLMLTNLTNSASCLVTVEAFDFWYFIYFGLWAALSFTFTLFFIKETRGLADIERKELYRPLDLLDSEIERDPTELKPRFTAVMSGVHDDDSQMSSHKNGPSFANQPFLDTPKK
jgi:hypothetical protein